jgi:5-hydroxyisourate hydrolase
VTLSTHVLDASVGRPAEGVTVRLERRVPDGTWALVAADLTDADGRLRFPGQLHRAVYRITFGTGDYFAAREIATFYPEVTVTFETAAAGEHHHVPLLLSPFAYSTYRGT